MIKLLKDDYNETFVWVDCEDEWEELSPEFTTEQAAKAWLERIKTETY
jgi:hypothetical protein